MRLLIIHPEAKYFGGAEKMLGNFLKGLAETEYSVALASADSDRPGSLTPTGVRLIRVPDTGRFSPARLVRQVTTLVKFHRSDPIDMVHAWAARDWELAALVGFCIQRPVLGTLHDHPQASFISQKRQRLMRWCARAGLNSLACVSDAVLHACLSAGYPKEKLRVIHNGLALDVVPAKPRIGGGFRFGFLGVFSERKGLRDLFAILNELSRLTELPWEIDVAGAAQDRQSERLIAGIREGYASKSWWNRVHWRGWVASPSEWFSSLDVVIVPSSEFDPFPTVLLEAALAGTPVLATRAGGIPEIVVDGVTGWLFDVGDWSAAAAVLARLATQPGECLRAGNIARQRVSEEFSLGKMVANYSKIYSTLATNV